MSQTNRLASVDALRGLLVAAMLLVNNPGDWGTIYWPLEHAAWHGFTPTDLIFPGFLFIVGVSLALSLGPRLDRGDAPGAMRHAVLVRSLRIIGLGLILQAIAMWLFKQENFRVFGVLQRIGIVFGVVGLVALYLKPRLQGVLLAAVLLGYWALMSWGGDYSKAGNLANRVDSWVLGPLAYQYDPATGFAHEPEGLLSTLPSIATALLGLLAGHALRSGKLREMGIAAVACLVLGWVWSAVMPINKQLWTSSFVLWAGGWTLVALLLCHQLIDKAGWPAWGRSFGVNAIAAYAGAWVMTCVLGGMKWSTPLYTHAFAWMSPHTGPKLPSLAFAVCFVFVWWLVVRALDARKIYFKV